MKKHKDRKMKMEPWLGSDVDYSLSIHFVNQCTLEL